MVRTDRAKLNRAIGESMWKDLEHDFTRINNQRKEMCSVMAYRSDAD